jgi:hypothetical protein
MTATCEIVLCKVISAYLSTQIFSFKIRIKLNALQIGALQIGTSCTPVWCGKLCNPIILKCEAVHSKIFGVNNFLLQKTVRKFLSNAMPVDMWGT